MASELTAVGGATGTTEPVAPSTRPGPGLKRRKGRTGVLFVLPWIVGFFLWYAIPMGASLWFSVTDFDLTSGEPPRFIGFDNWAKLFSDPDVVHSALVTLKFGLISLPLAILVPLGFAYLLTAKNLWGRSFFRTMFYMPSIIPFVSAVLLFGGVLNSQTGWINRGLGVIGIDGPEWLGSTTWIYPALALIGLWGVGNAMIIFIAGMNSVPRDLFDAAKADGGSSWQIFRNVTLPIISPVTFYNIVIALIGLFQYFLVPFVLKNASGDPSGSTLFYSLYFFRVGFRLNDMGYAATLAWMLFAAGLVVTGILFWSAKYWVHYEFSEG